MSEQLKSRGLLVVVAALSLALGLALPRPGRRPGDMLDAVAAVQRRSPLFLISEPMPHNGWARGGALYLCRTPRTADDLETLGKHPWSRGPGWAGVVCFKGTADRSITYVPGVSDGGDRCLVYSTFAVYGDPELLEEVRALLAAEGLRPTSGATGR
jgi:hypothetical protein